MSRMFKPAETMTVYSRLDALAVRTARSALPGTQSGGSPREHADRLIVVEYEELAREPRQNDDLIYDRCGLPNLPMTFDNVSYEDGGF